MAMAVIEKQGTVLNVRPEGRVDTARTPLLDREGEPVISAVVMKD